MDRIVGVAASLLVVALLIIGAAVVKWYVWDFAIGQAGQSDRSMLFWGLPVLFIGLSPIGGLVALVALARKTFSKS